MTMSKFGGVYGKGTALTFPNIQPHTHMHTHT
uniref:Uncharacterized protein n=1 Tax=Anguilla anguilla TaxID=7936 RepID=A0A0E9WHP3_ANGAN